MIWDATAIGDVGTVLKTKSVDDEFAVLNIQRCNGDASKIIGLIFKGIRDYLGNATADLFGLTKNVAEVFFQVIECMLIPVTGQGGLIEKIKTS